MARTFTPAGLSSMLKGETDEVWHTLLTLDHPDLAQPIRVTDNGEDVASNGETFVAFPFDLVLASEQPKQPPQGQLRIDNVDQRVIEAIGALGSAPTVTIEVVKASDPDQREIGPFDMLLKDISYDARVITGKLGFDDVLSEPSPTRTFTPATAPGLFTG